MIIIKTGLRTINLIAHQRNRIETNIHKTFRSLNQVDHRIRVVAHIHHKTCTINLVAQISRVVAHDKIRIPKLHHRNAHDILTMVQIRAANGECPEEVTTEERRCAVQLRLH